MTALTALLRILFSTALCGICLFITNTAFADTRDPLKKIEQQIKKGDRNGRAELNELYSPKWFTAGSNFAKVFLSADGGVNLIDWINPIDSQYYSSVQNAERQIEVVTAIKRYKSNQMVDLVLVMIVPHPKYQTVRQLGLLKQVNAYEPPGLKVMGQTQIQIRNYPATIYEREEGGCSIVINLVKGAMLSTQTNSCKQLKQLTTFTEHLDIERLEAKLSS